MDKTKLKYCHGCLSTDRRLFPMCDYFNIYKSLMENELKNIKNVSTNNPSMCWECRALLRNVVTFQKRIKKAYKYLNTQSKKMQPPNKLSTLTLSYTDECISIIYEGENEFKSEVRHNEISLEDDIDVKIEISSIKNNEETDNIKDFNVDIKSELGLKEEFSDFELYEQGECNENIEYYVKEDLEEEADVKIEFKKVKIKKRSTYDKVRESMNKKYKFISNTEESLKVFDNFKKVRINEGERLRLVDEDRKSRKYDRRAFKCESCISGFAKEKYYILHMQKFHSKSSGDFECDICQRRFKLKCFLRAHITEHYTKYVCKICNFEIYTLWKTKSHLQYTHKRAVMCLVCGLKFEKRPQFYEHYNKMHTKVICDHCNKNFTNKQRLIRHIFRRHIKHRCDICKRDYSSVDALARHHSMNHVVSRTDTCYCVECDIQFDNSTRYNQHLKTSVKHRTVVGIPCPECNKVYHKRYTMKNHYKHVHLQKTDFFCDKCSRYFLNGFRLRQHTASVHDKIPHVKNKICPHCGRAFSTNRILSNHIKTHTGERPYACDVCQSTFAQKTALVVHKRAIHKDK